MKSLLHQETSIYLLTFLASIAISIFTYWQHGVINNDGILYVGVARNYVEAGIPAAFATFNWPFYGILIGITHQITNLDYESSAHFLNALLVALTCTSFVAIYKSIDQKGTRAWFAAILILSLPILNDYRDLIIRNFGFWAFSLVALLYFIRFSRSQNVSDAVLWQLAAIVATAFRIEGVSLFLAPIVYYPFFPATATQKTKLVAKSSFLFLLLGATGVLVITLYGALSTGYDFGTLRLWISYVSPWAIVDGIMSESLQLHRQLEYLSSTSEATIILSAGLFFLALFKIAANAVPPYLLITAFGAKKEWLGFGETNKIVLLFLVLALLTILSVLASRYFLSSRYTVTAVLFLSLITFQYVDIAFQKLAVMRERRWHIIGSAVILFIFLDGVISTTSPKVIMKSGAQWALQNLDVSKPCLSNELRLQFYTGDQCRFVSPESLSEELNSNQTGIDSSYLVLWLHHEDQTTMQSLESSRSLQLIDVRKNKKGDRVAIYATGRIPRSDRP